MLQRDSAGLVLRQPGLPHAHHSQWIDQENVGLFFHSNVGFGSVCHAARSSFDVQVQSQVFFWASFFFCPS